MAFGDRKIERLKRRFADGGAVEEPGLLDEADAWLRKKYHDPDSGFATKAATTLGMVPVQAARAASRAFTAPRRSITDENFDPESEAQNMAGFITTGGFGLSRAGLGPKGDVLGMGVSRVVPAKENIRTVLDSNFESGRVVGDETVPIDTLKGGVGREVGDLKRVDDLAAKIASPNGYIERLIVDQDGNVVEGQHRLEALRSLGVKDVPVTRVADNMAGINVAKAKAAVKAVGGIHSDNVNRVVANVAELLRTEGTPAAVRYAYDLTPHESAALDAMSALPMDTASRMARAGKNYPVDAYHGTSSDVKAFKPSKMGEFGPATYLTTHPGEATGYTGTHSGTPNIMPVRVGLKNPLRINSPEDFWNRFGGAGITDEAAVAAAQKEGYDGLIFKRPVQYWDNAAKRIQDTGETQEHIIVFPGNEHKIRSRFAAFDPAHADSPDLLKAKGGRVVARYRKTSR